MGENIMKNKGKLFPFGLLLLFLVAIFVSMVFPQEKAEKQNLDDKVKSFLEKHRGKWHDLNIPEADGKILFDLIVKHDYQQALEIGTSTGRSAIWIAWALSKTGGKLITIEIDEQRHREAVKNFEEAGLSEYIDARLADAHQLVKELKGPFNFVFCDADKGWYKQYFIDIYPKLELGGCYVAHNVTGKNWYGGGAVEFYDYIKSLPDMETTIDNSGRGMSISFKKNVE